MLYVKCVYLAGVLKIRADKKSEPKTVNAKRIGMIAGGTGITPMLQLIRQVLKDSDDKTELSLLFANQVGTDLWTCCQFEWSLNLFKKTGLVVNIYIYIRWLLCIGILRK